MFEKIISKNPEKAGAVPPSPSPSAAPVSSAPSSSSSSAPASPPVKKTSTSGQRNILSSDVSITGSVRFTNDLLVDGKIDGEISSDGALTVAENAVVKAEIKTKSVVIYGKVHGNIHASERIEIKSGAEMVGDLKAATLSVEPGAIFVGKSAVGAPSAQPQKNQGQPVSTPPQGNQRKNPQHKAAGAA